ncbi:MAG: 5-formyltetrahydrofolate cyclo-ligase [Pseudomonadota bacterium]|nr:5-formyltetrahydrofolate cyclo-ligase [Pseudomonadota bacterium]
METKSSLRQFMRALRARIDPSTREHAAKEVLRQLEVWPDFLEAEKIGVYYPREDELNIKPLIENCWRRGKLLFLPVYKNKKIYFHEFKDKTRLVKSIYGIYEPDTSEPEELNLDLVLVPSIAVDANSYRIGYGAGAYDRVLCRQHISIKKIVYVAYKCNFVTTCFPEDHDIAADKLLIG